MKKLYLAYGSNLNLMQMMHRCSMAIPIGTSILNDYRLVFKGIKSGYSYLTIEPSKGSFVPLGVYEISEADEKHLDKYENYPKSYYKKYITFEVDGSKKEGMIYIMQSDFSYNEPSRVYLETCLKGYEDFGFDDDLLYEALNYSLNNSIKR